MADNAQNSQNMQRPQTRALANRTERTERTESPTQALVQRAQELNSPALLEWALMREQADVLIKTGFLPSAIDKPEKAVAIMMKGRELGVQPMHALNTIAIIKGKPVAGAELLLALIYRDHGDEAIQFVESSQQRCEIKYKRRNAQVYSSFAFTMDDARKANLASKDNWVAYPAAMLRARCISAVAKMGFADSIGGMYTPEELGAAVTVSASGEVEIADEQPEEEPRRATQSAAPNPNLKPLNPQKAQAPNLKVVREDKPAPEEEADADEHAVWNTFASHTTHLFEKNGFADQLIERTLDIIYAYTHNEGTDENADALRLIYTDLKTRKTVSELTEWSRGLSETLKIKLAAQKKARPQPAQQAQSAQAGDVIEGEAREVNAPETPATPATAAEAGDNPDPNDIPF